MEFQVFLLKNSKRRFIIYLTMITFCVIIISILFASISNASQSLQRCDLNKKFLWSFLGSVRSDVLECPRSSCDDYEEEAAKILISHLLTKESGKGLSWFIFKWGIKHIILSSLLDELYSYAVTIGEIELKKTIEKIKDMLNKEPEEQIEGVEFSLGWKDIGGTITCFPLEKEGPYSRQIGEALIIFRSPHSLTVKEVVEEIEGEGYLYVPPANLRSKKEELKKYHLNEKVRPFTLVMIGTIYEVGSVIITQDWRKTIGGPIVNFFQTSELPKWEEIIPPTTTALVIDHSGSMGDKRKLELAQEAARSYIDSVPEEDYVSVAGFSTDASSIVGLSSIKTSKEQLKQCILSLHSTSSTNIGAGLRVGMEQIFVEGQRPQKPIILLLSDGMHNTGELWPWVEECKKKQVKVYTVAFGSDADQVTLCKIAYQTGGRCFPAGIKNLSHIYHKANIYVHNNSTLFASSDWLKPGQELKYKVDVPSDFRNLTFFTNWQGSSIQTVIVKPDGSLIYPSSQMGDYQKGNTYSIFRVPAETGIWELKLSGQDLPQEGEQINVSISGKSEIYSNFLTFQPEYKQGQRVLIRVEVADVAGNQKIPLENIKVKAKIEGPTPQLLKKVGKGKFEINPLKILMGFILKQQEIDLYDDGAHDDYDSKDGIYGGTFLGGDILGPYLVTAIIEGQSQGKIISRQIQESFQIGPIQNNKLTISDFIQIRHR
jgi:hypothetical protein